jgi:hypothetical protein
MIIEPRGDAMHCSDECPRPAANHAEPEAPI